MATILMKELLGVDFTTHPVLAPEKILETKELQEKLNDALKRLSFAAQLVIEVADPRLVLPTNIDRMHRLSKDMDICNFPSKIDDFIDMIETSVQDEIVRQWIKGLIATSSYDSAQALTNAKYIIESLSDPTFFYLVIIGTLYLPDGRIEKDELYSEEDISLLDDEEYHIAGLYQTASFYREHLKYCFSSEQDQLSVITEKCRELISKLDLLSSKLIAWVKENKKPYNDKTD